MCELFQETEHPHNLRNNHTFRTYNVKTVQYETETLSLMGAMIWSLVPSNIKNLETLEARWLPMSWVNTEKKSTSVAPKAPKLYEHETRVAQKAGGALGGGGCCKPPSGSVAGPWWGEVPENVLVFWRPKDTKTA